MNDMRMLKLSAIALAAYWVVVAHAADAAEPPAGDAQHLSDQEKRTQAVLREAFEAYWQSQQERPGGPATPEEKERAFQQYWEGLKKQLAESDKKAEVSLYKVFNSECEK